MKTIKKMMGATLLCGGIFALGACNDETGTSGGTASGAVETTLENYLGYANVVAQVLSDDAFKAYALWMGASNLQGADAERAEALEVAGLTDGGYAARFKSHVAGDQSYSSEQSCLYAIFDGCIDIATEVADAKMGEPYNNGDVYGVESWYSFNSYTDYDDNIVSIENCYMGGPEAARDESKSLYQFCRQFDAIKADAVKTAIEQAHDAFDAAKAKGPFRDAVLAKKDGTSSPEVETAMAKVAALGTALSEAKTLLSRMSGTEQYNQQAQAVIDQYVDKTILATYQELNQEAAELQQLVKTFSTEKTQASLEAACEQWKNTRKPWEMSEAFLFGPIADQQLDPHLDSWPLSQTNIKFILRGDWDWATEDGSSMGASTLGFHTLEYLLFENGAPRVLTSFIQDGKVTLK